MNRIALCLAAAMLAATPLFAQEPETRRVKISPDGKSGIILIEDDADEVEKLKSEVEALRKRVRELETELEKVEKDEGASDDLRERMKKVLERARNNGEAQEKVEEALEKVEDWAPRIRIKRVDGALPQDFQKRMEEMEKRMEEFRKRHMEDMDKALERMRKQMEELENDPEAEVEEWEETSKDGSSTVKIKIVRKSSKSESTTPEAEPAKPKTEERKQ